MAIPEAKGFAIVTETGAIITTTVSPTTRGAQARWLMDSEGLMIHPGHTDAMVQHIFDQQAKMKKVQLLTVIVKASEAAP